MAFGGLEVDEEELNSLMYSRATYSGLSRNQAESYPYQTRPDRRYGASLALPAFLFSPFPVHTLNTKDRRKATREKRSIQPKRPTTDDRRRRAPSCLTSYSAISARCASRLRQATATQAKNTSHLRPTRALMHTKGQKIHGDTVQAIEEQHTRQPATQRTRLQNNRVALRANFIVS